MSPPQTPIRETPSVIVATPPPRMQPISQQVTPPRSPSLNDSSRPMQRKTSVRPKAPLHPELEASVASGPLSPSVTRILSNEGIHPPGLKPNSRAESTRTTSPLPLPCCQSRMRAKQSNRVLPFLTAPMSVDSLTSTPPTISLTQTTILIVNPVLSMARSLPTSVAPIAGSPASSNSRIT